MNRMLRTEHGKKTTSSLILICWEMLVKLHSKELYQNLMVSDCTYTTADVLGKFNQIS